MAPRRRLHRPIALLFALLAAALVAAGCGGEDDSRDITGEPFSEGNVADFSAQLDLVQDMVDEEDCEGAIQKTENLTGEVDNISSDVDQGLKDDLKDLLGRLTVQIGEQCEEPVETTSTSTTDEDTTTSTEETTTSTSTTTTTTEEDTTTPPPDEGDEGDDGGTVVPTPPGQGGTPGGTPPSGTDPGDSGGITPREER